MLNALRSELGPENFVSETIINSNSSESFASAAPRNLRSKFETFGSEVP